MISLQEIIEALLFAAGDAIETEDIARVTGYTVLEIGQAVEELKRKYADSGIRLFVYGDKIRLGTHPEAAGYIEDLLYPVQKKSFSKAALEILSIVAYKQPVTRAEIEAIRGVQCDRTISNLIMLDMIKEVGRKDTLGRPVLLGTTDNFLLKFGLSSLAELPEKDLAVLIKEDEQEEQ